MTFIVLKVLGESFNLMTLGGLAAAVGLVIDDAIVVVENIVAASRRGRRPLEAIHSALRGDHRAAGRLDHHADRRLPAADCDHRRDRQSSSAPWRSRSSVSLLTSLALALTWTPTLSQYFIRRASNGRCSRKRRDSTNLDDADAGRRRSSRWGHFRRVVAFYERCLRFALERPRWIALVRGASCIVLLSSLLQALGTDLLPADGRRRIRSRLLHAAGSFARRRPIAWSRTSKKSFAPCPKSKATRGAPDCSWTCGGHRSQQRRFRRQAEEQAQPRHRRNHGRTARQDQKEEPGADVEFAQVLQDMIGDLTNAPEPVADQAVLPDADC